jgi:hypothetical protein
MENLSSDLSDALPVIKNRGTNGGGKNTNVNGKKFEQITSNYHRLIEKGFERVNIGKGKNCYYLRHITSKGENIFLEQNGFKLYMKEKYNLDFIRNPDEAYIVQTGADKPHLIILEKKEQNVEGSVDTKLYASPGLKKEYELIAGDKFYIEYIFCLSKYFKNKFMEGSKKYALLNQIFIFYNIHCLFGEDENYFESLDTFLTI